jgi:hypothetical protein
MLLYRAADNGYSVTDLAPPRILYLVHWERTRRGSPA